MRPEPKTATKYHHIGPTQTWRERERDLRVQNGRVVDVRSRTPAKEVSRGNEFGLDTEGEGDRWRVVTMLVRYLNEEQEFS